MKTENTMIHTDFFGSAGDTKTNAILKQLNAVASTDADFFVFDFYNDFRSFSFENPKNMSIENVPENVPPYVWSLALSDILAETVEAEHGRFQLCELMLGTLNNSKNHNSGFFENMLAALENLTSTGRNGLLVNNTLSALTSMLRGWTQYKQHPLYDMNTYLNSVMSSKQNNVCSLLNLDRVSKSFLMKYTLAYEFYGRKHNPETCTNPLYIVVEDPHLLFPKTQAYYCFMDELIQHAKRYNMFYIFNTTSETDLSPVCLECVDNKVIVPAAKS